MKKFDYKKFLVENKLTIDSRNINEMESRLDVSQVDMGSLELDGFSQEDPTDLADVYIVSAQFLDGRELSDDERDQLLYLIPDVIYDKALERMSSRAEDSWDARYDESKGKKNFKSNMREASLAGNKRDELIDYLAFELEYIWKMGKDNNPKNFKRISGYLIGYLENELSIKDEMDEGNSDSTSKGMFAVEKPNGEVVKHLNSEKEAQDYIDKIDPKGMIDFNIRKV
jgi:hypothetical protein